MAVLFDLDGTLLDTSTDFLTAANAVLSAENKAIVDHAAVRRHISFGSRRILAGIFNLNLDSLDDKDYLERLLPRFIEEYRKTEFSGTVAFPGINELLSELEKANMPWGIVTNKNTVLTEPLLKNTGYFTRSGCVVCGDTTAKPKPAPDPLFHACDLLKVDPTDCIFIGDSINDILAGKAAGMRTIAAAFGFIPEDVNIADWQADVVVQSPHEILPWIQKWAKPTS
jgi:phosphoglycolate phosphatase